MATTQVSCDRTPGPQMFFALIGRIKSRFSARPSVDEQVRKQFIDFQEQARSEMKKDMQTLYRKYHDVSSAPDSSKSKIAAE